MVKKWCCGGCRATRESNDSVNMKVCHKCQVEMSEVLSVKDVLMQKLGVRNSKEKEVVQESGYVMSAVSDTEEEIRGSIGMGLAFGGDEDDMC